MKRLPIVLATLLLGGCIKTNFDPPYLVKSLRILGMSAQPPESAFGSDITFEALVVDAKGDALPGQPGVEMRWTVCLSAAAIINAAGLGFGMQLSDNCSEGGSDLVHLETAGLPPNSALLPGSAFLQLIQNLSMDGGMGRAGDAGTGGLDPMLVSTLTQVISQVGVPLQVRLEVWKDGEQVAVGVKDFAVTERANPTTNPPPPRFAVSGVWLSARGGGDPHTCVPEQGQRPKVQVATQVDVTPDPQEAPWLESYPVYNLNGTMQIDHENAYYSWFSTGGRFKHAITQRPSRDNVWTTPHDAGVYPLWVVVRDGHLGQVWCRSEVEVTPKPGG